ncbi:chemotaxis protein MotC [Aminobacter sp. HY435]|uniref:chemotaxis protein MotC n=1 Tax=Aminobacter sp. HY435 TaxID=2970917 RepID=UPI0022B9A8D8|nr:chemotaxis protein MotC [Aminobacter sp. HY435]
MRLAAALSGVALVAIMVASGRAHASEAPALEPYQMVRCLQLVQDRIATGDQASLPMQRRLLEMTDERMRTADPASFKEPKNFRALLIYAMSGGNPLTIEQVISRLTLEDADRTLAQGVIDYLRGKPKGTVDALATVDPLAQVSELGAFLALVKGSVSINQDPEAALKLFDQARVMSPGTLVEEAALRRSVALTPKLGDGSRFLRNSVQYVRSYLRSPYASQFADAFVAGVVDLHSSIDFDTLGEITAMMDAEQERVVYLRIARRAAIDGLTELSSFASRKAEQGRDGKTSGDDPRSQLYSGISAVTSGSVEDMLGKLGGIDHSKLSKGDRALLDAAEAVASEVTSAVPAATPPAAASKPADIAELPPAAIDIPSDHRDPMIPDAIDAEPAKAEPAAQPSSTPAPAAKVRQIPLGAPAASTDTARQPETPSEPDDPKIVQTRRTLEAIDELLGASPQ